MPVSKLRLVSQTRTVDLDLDPRFVIIERSELEKRERDHDQLLDDFYAEHKARLDLEEVQATFSGISARAREFATRFDRLLKDGLCEAAALEQLKGE